ncbi:hypothetical protein [Novosphingobium sp. BL-52-GroH]|uniref:hypothetical protein n=1 Tax=Novosphingobium sp. BL-52-GroH TaxID=3349877 RepID=UPI003851713C
MKFPTSIIALIALQACATEKGSDNFNDVEKSRWANDSQDCHDSYVSFDKSLLQFHFKDGNTTLGRIINPVDQQRPNGFIFSMEPDEFLKANTPNLPRLLTLSFSLNHDRLSLYAMVAGENGEMGGVSDKNSTFSRWLDLKRCAN